MFPDGGGGGVDGESDERHGGVGTAASWMPKKRPLFFATITSASPSVVLLLVPEPE